MKGTLQRDAAIFCIHLYYNGPMVSCARFPLLPVLFAMLLPSLVSAAGDVVNEVAVYFARQYQAAAEVIIPAAKLDDETAQAVQRRFVDLLLPTLGPVVGYKAGLTSRAAQTRIGVSHPVAGRLLHGMLRQSPARIQADAGARLAVEGDLLVRVGNESINRAQTADELLAGLEAVIPFIEVPDLLFRRGETPSAAILVALNVGARFGVTGNAVALQDARSWRQRLSEFQVILYDGAGATLARGQGKDLLGHPLEVVRWLRDTLNAQGIQLVRGDLLSLGSLTPVLPVVSGQTIRASYLGLDPEQAIDVSVTIIDPPD
jgi:2-keto-4-pentenoate hydratase